MSQESLQNIEPAEKIDYTIPRILAISIFMEMLDTTILNTSLPSIAKDLGESPLNMQNTVVSYALTLALVMPLNGYLSDKFGTKRVFMAALTLFAIGSLLCAASESLTFLVISRVIQAVGGALMNPVGRLIMLKTYRRDQIITVFNYAVTPALIGPILGPLVGGYMVEYFSWHWIFLINIPVALFCILLVIKYIPNYEDESDTFDFKGFLIFASASLLFSVSLEMMGHPKNITPILLIILAAFMMLYFYFQYAKKHTDAIYPISLFSIRTFRVGIIGNLVTRLGISSVPLLMPLLIQVAFKQSAVVSGWMIAPMAVMAMFGKSMTGKILNTFSYRTVLRVNTIIVGVLILCLAIPGEDAPIYYYLPIIIVIGFFNSIQFTSMNTITISNLRKYQTSSGNSLVSVNQQLAIGFGLAFGSVVLRFFEKQVGDTHIHEAFRYTFLAAGTMTLLSALVFMRLRENDGQNMRSSDS